MSRVLLIGLDSADADLIERWGERGELPVLHGLRRDGLSARLETTADVLHVSAWPTLYTGTRPGQHGLYHAYQIRGGEQDVHRTAASECGRPPFWRYLDQAGVPCAVVDAFMDHALEGFGGLQLLEYGTWTWFEEPGSTPDALRKEVLRRFGPYRAPEHTKVHGQPPPKRFRDQLVAGAKQKGELLRWMMREQPWRFLFANFAEPHPAGHYLWHVQDTDYPTHPPGGLAGLGEAVLDVYRAVDTAIGGLLEELGEDDTVIVTSGDGMGPNYAGCHLVPEALHRLDLFHGAGVGEPKETKQKKSLSSAVRGMVPLGLRRAVSRCLPPGIQHRLSMKWANANIDWERTNAFCIPNANEAYVRVNLEGREPLGNVAQGEAYAELVARLQARLGELVNPTTGLVAAHRVVHVEDVFPGPRRHDLPDVIVTWDPEARTLAQLESQACGRIDKVTGYETAPYYTGNHRPAAFLYARGPHLAGGSTLEGAHLVDLAPTLLAHFGVEPPEHMEGRVRSELLGSPVPSPEA